MVTLTFSSFRVCRTFNEIATPTLYRNVNLLVNRKDVPKVEIVLNRLFLPHAQYIKTLYMWGTEDDRDSLADCNVKFLQECVELTSLGLYFNRVYIKQRWTKLQHAIVSLMERRNLRHLGLYAETTVKGERCIEHRWAVVHLLRAIANSEMARSHLKSLDLAVWALPGTTMDWILSNFPNLESLTIRNSIYSSGPTDQWRSLAFLTRLQLYKCAAITAPEMPGLVASFSALRELMVTDIPPSRNEPSFWERYADDWHLLPHALCNTHQRLDWTHIDRLLFHHIHFMGVIPTRTLIVTAIRPSMFVNVLESHPHCFPGMEVLEREKSVEYSGIDSRLTAEAELLEKWCAARNVEVVEGADVVYERSPWSW
ncbi:hypothetical protein CPB86DRAFT_490975 [Serendipita vermifera]|nr:hypothetical protein CPB86DRAFT_490975 [Serendipita vermifera]